MRTIFAIIFLIAFGLLMGNNLVDAEQGKKSEPGERLAPGHFMTPDGQIWDGDAMKRYFMGARSPFKEPKVKPQLIIPKSCVEYKDPWRE